MISLYHPFIISVVTSRLQIFAGHVISSLVCDLRGTPLDDFTLDFSLNWIDSGLKRHAKAWNATWRVCLWGTVATADTFDLHAPPSPTNRLDWVSSKPEANCLRTCARQLDLLAYHESLESRSVMLVKAASQSATGAQATVRDESLNLLVLSLSLLKDPI